MNLNVIKAFDDVLHIRFLHDMKKRRILKRLLKWIKDFLKKQRITLNINDYMMAKWKINMNISQNSLLSLVLYLFYNADLLKACDDIKLSINVIKFVNNINIMIYEVFTKRNCKMLNEVYNKCK